MNINSKSQDKKLSEIVIDIESQNDIKEKITNELLVPLKGILIKSDEYTDYVEFEKKIFRLCFELLILAIVLPIIICDLYFGLTDTSCSCKQVDELTLSIKLYLIGSGVLGVCVILITIFEQAGCFIRSTLFNMVIWNILGAILFWLYIYRNCNKTFSTYIFVSLIIKFATVLLSYKFTQKKDDKN